MEAINAPGFGLGNPDAGMPAAPRPLPTYPTWVRIAHWVNAVSLIVMVMSGLQIFNAHPALYAADDSDPDRVVLALPEGATDAAGKTTYQMTVLGQKFGVPQALAFEGIPEPITLGGWLAGARRIHFAAAWLFAVNGIFYLVMMLLGRRRRAIWPGKADLPEIVPAIKDHLKVPPVLHGKGGALNPLQKVAYLAVPAIMAPLIIGSGLALSPQWDAIFPFWTDLFGGRQFARTWHFLLMAAFVGFLFQHVFLVAISGPSTWRKMITGRTEVPPHHEA